MKSFQREHDSAELIIFEERQTYSVLMIAVIIITIVAVFAFTLIVEKDISLANAAISFVIIAIISLVLITQKTVTIVDSLGVSVRRRFQFYFRYGFGEITRAEAGSYKAARKEHGGYSLFAAGMFALHDTGVLVYLTSGKITFFSSKRADELAQAINAGLEKYEQKKYVRSEYQ